MKIDEKILNRFNELISEANDVVSTNQKAGSIGGRDFVDLESAYKWITSCLNLLKRVFEVDSVHLQKFEEVSSEIFYLDNVKSAIGILRAAKSDYENGYLFKTRTLIEAKVFDEFLEQSEELFKKNYYQAAAVIVGCVLEDGLRKLGQRKIPTFPTDKTIDPMNVELAKAGIYNALWQKKITALADLRNKAAHGKWTEFNEKDVEDMIRDVRRFMEDYFS